MISEKNEEIQKYNTDIHTFTTAVDRRANDWKIDFGFHRKVIIGLVVITKNYSSGTWSGDITKWKLIEIVIFWFMKWMGICRSNWITMSCQRAWLISKSHCYQLFVWNIYLWNRQIVKCSQSRWVVWINIINGCQSYLWFCIHLFVLSWFVTFDRVKPCNSKKVKNYDK